MKRAINIKPIIFLLWLCFLAQNLQGQKYSINEAWTFQRENHQQIVSFPHTWNDRDVLDDEPGYYRGLGTYTKKTFIPQEYSQKAVYLYFEGANQVTNVFINGKHAGEHKGGYTRFTFDISHLLNYGTENEIRIAVTNAHDAAIPPLSADFTFFGGIYRDVYLDIREKVHIAPTDMASSGVYIRTPEVKRTAAQVSIETLLNNTTNQRQEVVLEHTILDPDGKPVSELRQAVVIGRQKHGQPIALEAHIAHPQLWSPATPKMYRVVTVLRDKKSGKTLETASHTFGLRWFRFDADKGFFINDEPLKLIGTNRHQDFKEKGNALDDGYHIRDIQLLKAMGGNFLRISHYPQDPLVLEMCDKLGILASVEIPIVNAVTESQDFMDNSVFMAEEMVKQSFNHPSLIMWSYMNEVMLRPPYKNTDPEYLPYCKEVNRHAKAIEHKIRSLDPSRYTMVAFHGNVKAYEDAGLFDVPMIVGWNLYQGWYGGRFAEFDRFLLNYKAKYPNTPTLITEYGADVDSRIHSFHPERFDFSVEYGDLYHEHYLQTIKKLDFVAGGAIWNLNDFHSEIRKNAVPHINSKGITETDRTPKNTYYLYQANLLQRPVVKIASRDWRYRGGIATSEGICKQSIKIYSNRTPLAVFHNGKFLGDVAIENGVGTIDVPFVSGINHVEARWAEEGISDVLEVDFALIPSVLGNDFQQLSVAMGTQRYFEEKPTGTIWIPEKTYEAGSWGYVGGQAMRPKTRFGSLPAAEINVKGTDLDPLFQTQRVGLEAFRADVPAGRYAVYLYWADLSPLDDEEVIPYNLGNDTIVEDFEDTVMDIELNDQPVLQDYNLAQEGGKQRAVIKKFYTQVSDKGLTVRFTSKKGRTVLNAVKIIRID